MNSYIRELPEYVGRLLWRMDTISGIAVGLGFFVGATLVGVSQNVVVYGTLGIITFSALEAAYALYRQERVMRSERERTVRVTARLGSLSANIPDPGPGKESISAHIFWEIWVGQDVSTDKLALNLIYVYDRPRWQFWKRARFPKTGIPPKGQDTTQYRKRIHENQFQPFKDDAVFEYVGDRMEQGDPHWLLELVLLTGVPVGEHRIPVFIDYEELQSRGTNPPL